MLRRTTLFTLLLVLAAPLAAAADFYVDAVNGDDLAGDGTEASPWRTITFALTRATQPGDTVRVRPGTYDVSLGESFPLRPAPDVSIVSTGGRDVTIVSGVPDRPVMLFDYPEGTNGRIEGLTILGGDTGLRLMNGHFSPFTHPLITNNTIAGNTLHGVYIGGPAPSARTLAPTLLRNVIAYNGEGVTIRCIDGVGCPSPRLEKNEIFQNASHGVSIEALKPPFSGALMGVQLEANRIARNGGVGVRAFPAPRSGNLIWVGFLNDTIVSNVGGGLAGYSYVTHRYYPPPYYLYADFSFRSTNVTLYGNTGLGGIYKGGDPGSSPPGLGVVSFTNSILWGNVPAAGGNASPPPGHPALVGASFSDVQPDMPLSTGSHDNISQDPQFVSPQTGDLRVRRTSPVIDRGDNFFNPSVFPYDFEGDPRFVDGDSDGTATIDMGADEFHTFVALQGTPASGQTVHFFAEAPPVEDGNLALVLLSGGDGSQTGGLLLPDGSGRSIQLSPDALFALSLHLPVVTAATLQNGRADMNPFTVPPIARGVRIFFAGLTMNFARGTFVTVTPTHYFLTQ